MKLTLLTKLAFAAIAISTMPAGAATISWSSGPFVNTGPSAGHMGTGQFDTSGIQILADNSRGSATTYDGITYTAGAISFGSGTFSGFHANNSNTGVSRFATYGSSGADTVTLGTGGVGSLEIGKTYRVQMMFLDGRDSQNGKTIEVDGLDQGAYANGVSGDTYGNGLLVTGVFTSDATSQDFTIEAFDGTTSKGGHLNALLLHEVTVPEPTTFLLLGTAAFSLVGIRRRK